jgi:hypothetical protein
VVDSKWDLKGSLQGRTVGYEECSRFSVCRRSDEILKDEDWEQSLMSIELSKEHRDQIIEELEEDVALLQSQQLMDYSLLVGVHSSSADNRVDDLKEMENGSIIRSRDGTLYFCAIIDILQKYNLRKQVEHFAKSVAYDGDLISAVHPDLYASRFLEFMKNKVIMCLDTAPSKIRRDWQLREDQKRSNAAESLRFTKKLPAAESMRLIRKAPHPPPPRGTRSVPSSFSLDLRSPSASASFGAFPMRRRISNSESNSSNSSNSSNGDSLEDFEREGIQCEHFP